MTVYNGGQYLKRSIKSVLSQTYRDFEFLIINDASTDDTVETIDSFHDDRIRLCSNDENIGQSRSLNKGLRLAKGKYVARIDADDIAFSTWVEDQYNDIEQDSQCAALSTKAVVIDENDQVRRIYHSPVDQDDIILRSFTFSPINHVGSILNRQVILDNGGYIEKYKIAADYGLWSQLIRNNQRITSSDKIHVAIRAHSSSFSQAESGIQELQDLADIMRQNINKFSSVDITEKESMILCRAFFDEGNLNDVEFDQSISVIKRSYGKLKSSSGINKKLARQWSHKRCLTAYLKRIHFHIKNNNFPMVREISRKGIKEFGPFSQFGVLFIANFLGKIFLTCIPMLHEKLMKLEAYFLSRSKLRTAGL